MTSKTLAVILGALLVMTNAVWTIWMFDASLTLDHTEQGAISNATASRVLIGLVNQPLEARTTSGALEELARRFPDIPVQAYDDTIAMASLEFVLGATGLRVKEM